MTSKMMGENVAYRSILISCDNDGCGLHYDDKAIALLGGLHEMGWKMIFNDESRKLQHYCPAHKAKVGDQVP